MQRYTETEHPCENEREDLQFNAGKCKMGVKKQEYTLSCKMEKRSGIAGERFEIWK